MKTIRMSEERRAVLRAWWTPERRKAKSDFLKAKWEESSHREAIDEAWTPERRREAGDRRRGKSHSEGTKGKMRGPRGNYPPFTEEHKTNIGLALAGRVRSLEERRNVSEGKKLAAANRRAEAGEGFGRHSNRRDSFESKLWRKAVFERDDYACQRCGQRGCRLEAHHIKGWSRFKDLRHVVSNGVTFCPPCHGVADPIRARSLPKGTQVPPALPTFDISLYVPQKAKEAA